MGSRPGLRLVSLLIAVPISVGGALVWSRISTSSGPTDAVLSAPGDYLEPGASTNPPLATDRLPAVEFVAADGSKLELTSDGRPMVVNLWYSTCPPCARELVDFATVHEQLGEAVRFVGVNPLDSAEAMRRFAGDRGVSYELLRDPQSALADALGVVAYPVTLFVGRDGYVLEQTGALDAGELRGRIADHWAVG